MALPRRDGRGISVTGELTIPDMTFYWRVKDSESPTNPFPDKCPFKFGFRSDLDLIVQQTTPEILANLKKVYGLESNIGYRQDANTLAKPYGTDLTRFIKSHLPPNRSLEILELGCGGCTVLHDLQKDGHKVTGLDPSPVAFEAAKRKHIDLIQDFFPSGSLSREFDLIYHSDVLEHISDPKTFLELHRNNLKERGMVLVSVPDCTESIGLGDASMIHHQHINYFDEDSLRSTFENAGFEVRVIEKAKYGGSLYGLASLSAGKSRKKERTSAKFDNFKKTFERNAARLDEFIGPIVKKSGNPLGFYVPLRAIPYLAYLKVEKGFRFFDDTPHWHRKEFDGVPVTIENMDDFNRNPPETVVITSLTFGDVIKDKIRQKHGDRVQIRTLREFL